ncbi:hypothetical protein ECN1_1995, partial [Escherichia coli N1]
MGDPG